MNTYITHISIAFISFFFALYFHTHITHFIANTPAKLYLNNNNSPSSFQSFSQNNNQSLDFNFIVVADPDQTSRDPQELKWHSYFRKGILHHNQSTDHYSLSWEVEKRLTSTTATKNRSMELSCVIQYQNVILAVCDYTGIVYEIDLEKSQIYSRFILADGSGNETQPFKTEWCTIKDDVLYFGSFGTEWITDHKIVHYFPEWVKKLDSKTTDKFIINENWKSKYNILREITNTTYPGYMTIESITYNPYLSKWIILPRKLVATDPTQYSHMKDKTKIKSLYDEDLDETSASNLMIMVNEDFTKVEKVVHVGNLEMEKGFTDVEVIPDGKGTRMVSLKVVEYKETENSPRITMTWLVVFDVDGKVYLEELISKVNKFEGITFLH